MVRSLPEHTIDAWVAVSICTTFPDALIWAPTPRNLSSGWDYGAELGDGKTFLLENKATELLKSGSDHEIKIGHKQLNQYCTLTKLTGHPPLFYVLPNPPWLVQPNQTDPVPLEAAHRIVPVPFGDWTWVVSCLDLKKYVGRKKSIRTSTLPSTGWSTLSKFLQEVKACNIVPKIQGNVVDRSDLNVGTQDDQQLQHNDTLLAVFVPKENLPNWDGRDPVAT